MHDVIAWIFALAVQFAPPERAQRIPTWDESVEDRRDRYAQIAEDIYRVTYDVRQAPLPGLSRAETAAMVLAVAIGESGLAPDADLGPCYRGAPGWAKRCDSGRAVGILQVWIPAEQQDLYWSDRRLLIAEGLRRMRISLRMCWRLPPHFRLAAYGSGSCDKGRVGAAKRWGLGLQLIRARELPGPDEDFLIVLEDDA